MTAAAEVWVSKLTLIGVLLAGLLLALYAGIMVVDANAFGLILLGLAVLLLFYTLTLQQKAWLVALAFCFMDYTYATFGFKIHTAEFTALLGGIWLCLHWWRRGNGPSPELACNRLANLTQITIVILLTYGAIHFYYNLEDPVLPDDFSIANASKTLLASFAPWVIVLLAFRMPKSLSLGASPLTVIQRVLFVFLVMNTITRGYFALRGKIVQLPMLSNYPFAYIPFINAFENIWSLRFLCPTSSLISVAILTAPSARPRSFFRTVELWSMLGLSLLASLVSGGRFILVICVFYILVILFLRKKIVWIVFIGALSFFFLALLNIFAGTLLKDPIPMIIQRSVVLLVFTDEKKYSEGYADIQGSSNWRWELFRMGIQDWQASSRTFWFGRSVFEFGYSDFVAQDILGAYEAHLETSFRRGATHSLLSDLLVTYGLVGCLLYYLCLILLFCTLIQMWRQQKELRQSKTKQEVITLGMIAMIVLGCYTIYSSFNGGYFHPSVAWLVVVFILACDRELTQIVTNRAEVAPCLTDPKTSGSSAANTVI